MTYGQRNRMHARAMESAAFFALNATLEASAMEYGSDRVSPERIASIDAIWEELIAEGNKPAQPGDSETDRRITLLSRSKFEKLFNRIKSS